jgi:hypothetical protein
VRFCKRHPVGNPFIRALEFRTAEMNVNTDALYFTAGYNNHNDGLFDEIAAAPSPERLRCFSPQWVRSGRGTSCEKGNRRRDGTWVRCSFPGVK